MTAPPTATPERRSFRQDINALRAWAVSAVVLFHFGIAGATGGFAGVDVFFVISGYLMTRIIMQGLPDGTGDPRTLSLPAFYLARARRIIPALLVMVLATLALGGTILTSTDYAVLGNHATYALLFLSNVRFWRESGYFDTDATEKWLLHTWSLSVEWQFYILLPILMLLLWRLLRQHRGAIVLAYATAALASLGLSVWLAGTDAHAAFYAIQSRAWEMMAGGLVYFAEPLLAKRRLPRTLMSGLGLLAILCAVFMFDESMRWPGLAACIPVAGTMLVLAARHEQGMIARSASLQWLGTRSYSIYLWHWPLVVLLAYYEQETAWPMIAGALLLTLLLGDLSYRCVETPSQRWLGRMRTRPAALAITAAVIAGAALGAFVKAQDGLPQRLPASVLAIEQSQHDINPRRDSCHGTSRNSMPGCIFGGPELAAVMLGDSHASATITALEQALPPGKGALLLSYTGCPTIAGVRKTEPGHGCHDFNRQALARIDSLPAGIPVIVVNRLSAHIFGESPLKPPASPEIFFDEPYSEADAQYLSAISNHSLQTYCQLAEHRPVYLLRPIPEMTHDIPDVMARAAMRGTHATTRIHLDDYQRRHAYVRDLQDQAARICKVHVLDPLPYLCDTTFCYGEQNGTAIYTDDNHLSESGNRLLVPLFKKIKISSSENPATGHSLNIQLKTQ